MPDTNKNPEQSKKIFPKLRAMQASEPHFPYCPRQKSADLSHRSPRKAQAVAESDFEQY
jgi:hypothetical protein